MTQTIRASSKLFDVESQSYREFSQASPCLDTLNAKGILARHCIYIFFVDQS